MELALVLLCVLVGVGAIVYAGLRRPAKPAASSGDGGAPVVSTHDHADGGDGGSGDGGGGGGGD